MGRVLTEYEARDALYDYEMDKFDAAKTAGIMIANIRTWFNEKGENTKAIIGISGGADSYVAAKLCCKALGEDRVFGVLMPNGAQSDIDDSYAICRNLHIKYQVININDAFNSILNPICEPSEQTIINLPPRLRMAALFAVAQTEGGFVVNTTNASEAYVGYGTLFGDTAGSIALLRALTKDEVIAVGKYIGCVHHFVEKTPSDGLSGCSDEDKLGVSYRDINKIIKMKTTGDVNIDKRIAELANASAFKRRIINIPWINSRDTGYPTREL